jgi:hypothetical protein
MGDRLADNAMCIEMCVFDEERRRRRVAAARHAVQSLAAPPPGAPAGPLAPPAREMTPAWAVLRGTDFPLLAGVRSAGGVVGSGLTLQETLQASLAEAVGGAAHLTPAQRAWFEDLNAASEGALCACAHLEAAAGVLQLAPWAHYLQAVVMTEEVMLDWTTHVTRSLRARREWMLQAVAATGGAECAPPQLMHGLPDLVASLPRT